MVTGEGGGTGLGGRQSCDVACGRCRRALKFRAVKRVFEGRNESLAVRVEEWEEGKGSETSPVTDR